MEILPVAAQCLEAVLYRPRNVLPNVIEHWIADSGNQTPFIVHAGGVGHRHDHQSRAHLGGDRSQIRIGVDTRPVRVSLVNPWGRRPVRNDHIKSIVHQRNSRHADIIGHVVAQRDWQLQRIAACTPAVQVGSARRVRDNVLDLDHDCFGFVSRRVVPLHGFLFSELLHPRCICRPLANRGAARQDVVSRNIANVRSQLQPRRRDDRHIHASEAAAQLKRRALRTGGHSHSCRTPAASARASRHSDLPGHPYSDRPVTAAHGRGRVHPGREGVARHRRLQPTLIDGQDQQICGAHHSTPAGIPLDVRSQSNATQHRCPICAP